MRYIRIFAFDNTVTKSHTFQHSCEENNPTYSAQQSIQRGRTQARSLSKINIGHYFKLNTEVLPVIVAYHNNPDFMAGFAGYILNRTVTEQTHQGKPIILFDNHNQTAVKVYSMSGSRNPLFISYIPLQRQEFSACIQRLRGKNPQLTFLRKILKNQGLLTQETRLEFYDDNSDNVRYAAELPFSINRHQVQKKEAFEIVKTQQEPPSQTLGNIVFPRHLHLSRENAESIAIKFPGRPLFRQSSSVKDTIVCTRYHPQDGRFSHFNFSQLQRENPAIPTPYLLAKHLQGATPVLFSEVKEAAKTQQEPPSQTLGNIVFPRHLHLSREDAESIARKFPGRPLFRQSSSVKDTIVCTRYHPQDGRFSHFNFSQLQRENPAIPTPYLLTEHLQGATPVLFSEVKEAAKTQQEPPSQTLGNIVFPRHLHLSRENAESIAIKFPGRPLFRQSSSIRGAIICTRYHPQDGRFSHFNFSQLQRENPAIPTPYLLAKHLQGATPVLFSEVKEMAHKQAAPRTSFFGNSDAARHARPEHETQHWQPPQQR